MTDLRFSSDWNLAAGLALAVGLTGLVAWLYWREVRTRTDALRWALPLLRAGAVLLLVLIFTGPLLHHRKVIGQVARVLVFLDASASMGLEDATLDPHRQLLIAQQQGALAPEAYDATLQQTLDALTQARAAAGSTSRRGTGTNLAHACEKFSQQIELAATQFNLIKKETWPEAATQIARFRKELLVPATQLDPGSTPAGRVWSNLNGLASSAAKWERQVQEASNDYLRRLAGGSNEAVQQALRSFSSKTRWQRLEAMVRETPQNLLGALAAKHHVELRALTGNESALLWQPQSEEVLQAGLKIDPFLLSPTNHSSALSGPISKSIEAVPPGERVAVVLFSDGQHNHGASPIEMAKVLGNRGIPLFPVGLGSTVSPPDVAVLKVTGPESVFIGDRAKGEILVKDELPAGDNYVVKIEYEGETVWAQTLTASRNRARVVPFDFPIKQAVERQFSGREGLTFNSLPVTMKVSVTSIAPERVTGNNEGALRFRAIKQRPRLLLLDGRPRWEFRYIRNLFERDDKWEVTSLLAGAGGGEVKPWPRGPEIGKFPGDRETLFSYHLICFGDLPPGYLKNEELEWIKEFVEKRGGGLMFIDGRQEQLSNYARTPLGSLLPVTWQGTPLEGANLTLQLTASGTAALPLTLAPGPAENAALWSALPGPRWFAAALPLPGTDVLLTAKLGERSVPAIGFRRFGAGRVLYAGFDESWRWRVNVGDRHHQRYWNQLGRWIMDAPYPVSDQFVSLDTGPFTYAPGESAAIRAQVRDRQGRLLSEAKAEAQIFRAGQKIAAIPLAADEGGAGVYRGQTSPLAEGTYEVRVSVEGLPAEEMKARSPLVVEPESHNELAELNCHEELLKEMAFHSGGEYFREEEASRLLHRLSPLSQGKVIESETLLWQSGWWYGLVVSLFTLEWFLRKRAGML